MAIENPSPQARSLYVSTVGREKNIIREKWRGIRPPVLVTFYDRFTHLRRLLDSICRASDVENYDFFIFQDACTNWKQKSNLKKTLLEIAEQYSDKLNLYPIFRQKNFGPLPNANNAISLAIDAADAFIFMEDDLEVSKGFFKFMEAGINAMEQHDEVVAVNGYLPPITTSRQTQPIVPIKVSRFSGWGFASTGDRWKRLRNPKPQDYFELASDELIRHKVANEFGLDVFNLMGDVSFGLLEADDVSIWIDSAINDWKIIAPSETLVKNHGLDGSGVHCVRTNRFDNKKPLSKQIDFDYQKVDVCLDTIKSSVQFRNLN